MRLIQDHNDINDLPENLRNLRTIVDLCGLIWTQVDPLSAEVLLNQQKNLTVISATNSEQEYKSKIRKIKTGY